MVAPAIAERTVLERAAVALVVAVPAVVEGTPVAPALVDQ